MKNKIQLFKSTKFGELPKNVNRHIYQEGFVYAVQFGKDVKVGKTQDIRQRIKEIQQKASYAKVSLGNLLLSPLHVNFDLNEKILHTLLPHRIKNTELFEVSLNVVEQKMKMLNFRCLNDEKRNNLLCEFYEKQKKIEKSAESFVNNIIGNEDEGVCVRVPMQILKQNRILTEDALDKILTLLEKATLSNINEPFKEELCFGLLNITDYLEKAIL